MNNSAEILDGRDERTVTMLYRKLGPAALSKTWHIVLRRDVAEEVVQETFAKMWKQGVQFDSLRSAYSWVYKTCTNAAVDYLRKKGHQEGVLVEGTSEEEDREMSPVDRVALGELMQLLIQVLNKQESSYFILQHVEGLQHGEIAEVLGVSRRTVLRLQQRVDKKLAKVRGERDEK
ncbi:MAG: RNA polymerase sigma factor [Bdellovibrionales bacterium]|nr:RNA polymerase sigma factor [Bdellovibrionales bacterium]